MITTLKPLLKQTLTAAGVSPVYTDMEDEAKIKGLKFAWVYVVDPERVIRDGDTIVAKDDRFYIREYELRLKVGIRIAARTEAEANGIKTQFLNALAISPNITDPQGFDIELTVLTAEFIGDKSILKTGCGYDVLIEALGGVYRPANPALADPWVLALTQWTASILAAPWRVYAFYPVGKPDLTMYWQVSSVDVEEKGLSAYTVRKKLTGHIFARNDMAAWAAMKIAEGLQNDFKIPLNAAQRKYMTTYKPEVNLKNAPITSGQVSVTLTRNTSRPTEEVPLIGRVSADGKLQEVNNG